MSDDRLSVPRSRTLPRPLSAGETAAYVAVADLLCGGGAPAPGELPSFPDLLHRALRLRSDAFDTVVRLLAEVPAGLAARDRWLRRLHRERPGAFAVLSTVAAGAYLMEPTIRAAIGYPGQRRDRPRVDEAADDLTGLLGA